MSNEEIYRQISELEQEIVELRSQLPPDQDWTAPKLDSGKSLEEQKRGDAFRIHSKAEMELTNLPDLARLILDALPVQVYIKKADIDETGTRQYTYLNKAVRDLDGRGWSRDAVKTKCDRDVFAPGPRGDELYNEMQAQESKTIHEGKSRITRTAYNMSGGYWSRNENIEVPILDQNAERIGFCSLAQNHDFAEASRLLAIYQQKAHHRVRHLISSTTGSFQSAHEDLEGYCKAHPEANTLRSTIARLNQIRHELRLFAASSRLQIQAWDSMGSPLETGTLRSIIEDLQRAYNECGFQLVLCKPTENDINKRVLQPKTVQAILSIFIGNAVGKHQPLPDQGVKQCTLSCCVTGDEISWTVSNPCRPTADAYTVPDEAPISLKEAMDEGFDRLMLSHFVLNALPGGKPTKMIHTTRSFDPDEFAASLVVEVVENA